MSLIRRNPYDPFYGAHQTMDHMMNQMRAVMNAALIPDQADALARSQSNPLAVDVMSDEKAIIVRTALPGFKEDEVAIDVQGKTLTISAETKTDRQDTQSQWHIREMRYGHFSRSISLPDEVLADKADASLENGILTVKLPKQKSSVVQKIAVKARELLSGGTKKDS